MIIRNMIIDDYDGVYALMLSCRGMGLNSVDDSREGIARYLDRNPRTCFVAEDDGRIVGVILAGNDGRRGYIGHTAVVEEYRRRSLGRRLVNAAVDALSAEGISKVNLVVFKDNDLGNAFWEGIGFTQRTDLVYRNRTLVQMEVMKT